MAQLNDPIRPDDESEIPNLDASGYAQEGSEVEDVDAPRRAASARFVVDATVGSEAAMRDAMDPANQSLGEALRLSYRVLQAVILVLIVLFLVSGFQTVDDGQTGVKTVWGKIVAVDGAEALDTGAQFSIYPYPIGEFVLFQDENRTVDLGNVFAPVGKGLLPFEQLIERADVSTQLRPGPRGDGFLLTRDGDIAHLEVSVRYGIVQPGSFVRRVNDSDQTRDANRLVKLAVQRAAVQIVAEASLQELTDQTDDVRARIQQHAQATLDDLHCGIQITQIQVQRAYAALAIEKGRGDLLNARVNAAESVDKARQRANEALNKVAGSDSPQLIQLIEEYEDLDQRGDAEAPNVLAAIQTKMDATQSGEIAQIIQDAKGHKSRIEANLGIEYRRFASLLPAYRQNSRLLVRQQWLSVYTAIFSRPDAEMIYVPDPLMSMTVNITGQSGVQELRNKNRIEQRQREANMRGFDPNRPYILRARDMKDPDKSGRMLDVQGGRAVPLGGKQ
jgi:regulator of protease activity HflC (stomatin/prohibitin superfamily)